MPDWTIIITFGIILILAGFFLIAIGMMRPIRESKNLEGEKGQEIKKEEIKGGGVILIGPVPIVFGTDKKYALLLMILAIALMLLSIIFLKLDEYINK